MNYTDTESMYYDIDKHRYILTEDALMEEYGINLNDVLDSNGSIGSEELPRLFLNRVSKIIYNYIYSWAKDKSKTEYVISLPQYRDGIEEAMKELAYGWLMNNTDPSVFFTADPLETIKVNPAVQTILLNEGIIYRGDFFNLPQDWEKTRGEDY